MRTKLIKTYDGRFLEVPDATEDMMFPVRCRHCNHIYDMGSVTVVTRYSDCSTWICPGPCGVLVDERQYTGAPHIELLYER